MPPLPWNGTYRCAFVCYNVRWLIDRPVECGGIQVVSTHSLLNVSQQFLMRSLQLKKIKWILLFWNIECFLVKCMSYNIYFTRLTSFLDVLTQIVH
jgi:hypothetical protein